MAAPVPAAALPAAALPAAPRRARSILFACNFNGVRSPMAAELAREILPRDTYIASVGIRRGDLDPFAVLAMAEIGLDIGEHQPTTFEDLGDGFFDVVVTLAPEAHHRALELTRTSAVDVEYWPTLDATAFEGSREQRLDIYRTVRDGLARRIEERFLR